MYTHKHCDDKKKKNIPRAWDKLSYAGTTRVPPAEEPGAYSWPTFFIPRDEHGTFLDNEGKPIYAAIREPNNSIDFEGKQLEIVKYTLNNLTPHQIEIAKYWGTGPATKQWTPIIDRLIDTYDITAPRAARILACVQGALNDAFVLSWYFKFLWKVSRPNQFDQHLKTLLCTPDHPTYPSGHATVAGCAEVVLTYFFYSERERLHELAEECAISRLYAGVHFPIDNDEGLRLGRYIGALVVDQLRKQYTEEQCSVDYPILENKHANLMPPPYKQVIPFDYNKKCKSSVMTDKCDCDYDYECEYDWD